VRTTVDIPDLLYRRLKARAATEGRSVKSLLLEAAEAGLRNRTVPQQGKRVQLPLLRSAQPGSLKLDNRAIYELIGFP